MMFISWYLFFSTVAVLYYYMCVKMIKRYEDLRDFLSNIKNKEIENLKGKITIEERKSEVSMGINKTLLLVTSYYV
jgi:hypothetical protein